MDDIQKTQPTELNAQLGATPPVPPTAPVTPTPPLAPPAPYNAAPVSTTSEPRNFLATFLLTSYGGILGLRHFYLGQKTLGLVRLGLFLSYFVFLVLAIVTKSGVVGLIGVLAYIVAIIWAIVDFFVVYLSVKTDAEGQPLTRTNRDAKWAKVIFITTVVIFVLAIVFSFTMAAVGENMLKDLTNQSSSKSLQLETDSGFDTYDFDSYDSKSSGSLYDYQTQ